MKNRTWIFPWTIWTFRAVMAAVLIIVLFLQGWEYAYKPALPWSNLACLAVGAGGALLLFLLSGGVHRLMHSGKRRYLWIGLLSLLAGCLTFWCAGHYALTPGWDVGLLCETAQEMMWADSPELLNGYFSKYPNNILLTWLLSRSYLLSDALGIPGGQRYFVGLAVQSLGFALAAFLVYVCADKMVGERHPAVPLWCWFMMLILVCASPWVVVMYSDAAALILIMPQVWLAMKLREDGKCRLLWAALLFFIGVLSYHIKPQATLFLIATGIIAVFADGRRALRREHLRRTGALVLACLLGAGVAQGCFRLVVKVSGLNPDPEVAFGPAHYLMMGLNTEASGTYLEEDEAFSASFSTRKERTEQDLQRAGERVRAMGAGGLLEQAVRKILVNYSDGTFTWEKEGIFYAYDTYYFPWGSRWGYEHIPNFYISGEYTDMVEWSCSDVFRLIMQCAWMAVLLLCIFASGRRGDARAATVLLALLGVFLFGLLFEARARYLFANLPLFILAAGMGIGQIGEWVARLRRKKQHETAIA